MRLDLSKTYNAFFYSEKSAGLVLVACTLVSLAIANSALGADYVEFWRQDLAGLSIAHWVNDARY